MGRDGRLGALEHDLRDRIKSPCYVVFTSTRQARLNSSMASSWCSGRIVRNDACASGASIVLADKRRSLVEVNCRGFVELNGSYFVYRVPKEFLLGEMDYEKAKKCLTEEIERCALVYGEGNTKIHREMILRFRDFLVENFVNV